MARSRHSALLVITLALTSCASRPEVTDGTAITDVTVIDVVDGTARPNLTVVISGDRIVALHPSDAVRLAPAVIQVSGAGKFLMPGLWDMHVHTGGSAAHVRGVDFPLYVANGVTGVRLMSGDCFDNCAAAERTGATSLDTVRAWRRDIATGLQVGPRIVASSMLFDGPSPSWPASSYALSTSADAQVAVQESRARGADFLKVYGLLPPDVYYAVLDEAESAGLDVAGHVPIGVSLTQASEAGHRSIEHVFTSELLECSSTPDEAQRARSTSNESGTQEARLAYRRLLVESFDGVACDGFFETLRSNGTWYVPTLTIYRPNAFIDEVVLASSGRMRFVDPGGVLAGWWDYAESSTRSASTDELQMRRRVFARQMDFVATARKAGVRIMAGTDAWNPYVFAGFSIHDELEWFVQAGLSPHQSLQAATTDPAEFLGMRDSLGAVRAGFLADLVLLEENPLVDIGATRGIIAVVAAGRVFNADSREQLLAQAEAAARRPPGG